MSTLPTDHTPPVDGVKALDALVGAFAADPVLRWVYPSGEAYDRYFPELLQVFGGDRLGTAHVDHTASYEGAALWLAPGIGPDEEALGELLERSVDEDRHADVFAFLGQMDEHHPTELHWYLPFIGVRPNCQGRGHGRALLQQRLDHCDREGLPAFLEASSPRNRPLYERHGFEVIAEIQAGDSPPLWPMLRQPR